MSVIGLVKLAATATIVVSALLIMLTVNKAVTVSKRMYLFKNMVTPKFNLVPTRGVGMQFQRAAL
jgi:hypothetical protein